MKVYISLPVTGVKGYKERAEAIEKLLTEAGQTVINPVTICEKLPEKTTHNEYMSICLPLVDMCDAIVFDEGWESSRGCNLEMVRAMENKIEIGFIRENTWENQNKQKHTNLQRRRQQIYIRDNYRCIFCLKNYNMQNATWYGKSILSVMHYIPRSKGGLGIPQNGALGCQYHHNMLDNGNQGKRHEMLEIFKNYLKHFYPDWAESSLVYKKW